MIVFVVEKIGDLDLVSYADQNPFGVEGKELIRGELRGRFWNIEEKELEISLPLINGWRGSRCFVLGASTELLELTNISKIDEIVFESVQFEEHLDLIMKEKSVIDSGEFLKTLKQSKNFETDIREMLHHVIHFLAYLFVLSYEYTSSKKDLIALVNEKQTPQEFVAQAELLLMNSNPKLNMILQRYEMITMMVNILTKALLK